MKSKLCSFFSLFHLFISHFPKLSGFFSFLPSLSSFNFRSQPYLQYLLKRFSLLSFPLHSVYFVPQDESREWSSTNGERSEGTRKSEGRKSQWWSEEETFGGKSITHPTGTIFEDFYLWDFKFVRSDNVSDPQPWLLFQSDEKGWIMVRKRKDIASHISHWIRTLWERTCIAYTSNDRIIHHSKKGKRTHIMYRAKALLAELF